MKPHSCLVALIAGFVLLLNITPSWSQGVNPTVSDTNLNTAGGTNALLNTLNIIGSGLGNTAFGTDALQNNTTGSTNTASGSAALANNLFGKQESVTTPHEAPL